MMPSYLHIGDTVQWYGGFGTELGRQAVVTGITRTKQYEKYGEAVEQLPWTLIQAGYGIVDLANGHWAYGHQITPLSNEID